MLSRREWMGLTGAAILGAAIPDSALRADEQTARTMREYEKPIFDLPGQIKQPAKIESIELLKRGSQFFVRTRSADGAYNAS